MPRATVIENSTNSLGRLQPHNDANVKFVQASYFADRKLPSIMAKNFSVEYGCGFKVESLIGNQPRVDFYIPLLFNSIKVEKDEEGDPKFYFNFSDFNNEMRQGPVSKAFNVSVCETKDRKAEVSIKHQIQTTIENFYDELFARDTSTSIRADEHNEELDAFIDIVILREDNYGKNVKHMYDLFQIHYQYDLGWYEMLNEESSFYQLLWSQIEYRDIFPKIGDEKSSRTIPEIEVIFNEDPHIELQY